VICLNLNEREEDAMIFAQHQNSEGCRTALLALQRRILELAHQRAVSLSLKPLEPLPRCLDHLLRLIARSTSLVL